MSVRWPGGGTEGGRAERRDYKYRQLQVTRNRVNICNSHRGNQEQGGGRSGERGEGEEGSEYSVSPSGWGSGRGKRRERGAGDIENSNSSSRSVLEEEERLVGDVEGDTVVGGEGILVR